MAHFSPLSQKQLGRFTFLFDVVKQNMGFVPNSMKTMARQPAILGSFTALSGLLVGDPEKASPLTFLKLFIKNLGWSSKLMKSEARVPLYLRNLVAHISSNASGCRYCQAHTISEASHNGASEEQLSSVWEFETSTAFTDLERAALRFGYAAGSVPNSVTEQHFTDLRQHFTEEQIVELGATVALFGFLNRWNDTFATQLESTPIAVAEKYLSKSGWNAGKHG